MNKYFGVAAFGLVVPVLFYIWCLRHDRDKAVSDFNRANQQVAQLIKINRDQAGEVDFLNRQLTLKDTYINGLELRRNNTEQVLTPIELKFKKAKHENQSVNEWANQSLPRGLY